MEKEITNLDAFIALRDLDDEEIVIPASRHAKRLKEGKSFDVRNDTAMEAAQKFNEASEADDTLEVYDVDKDVIDRAIDSRKPGYAGDVILTCPSCHAQRVERVDNLDRSEDGTGYIILGDDAKGNPRQQCPSCRKSDVVWQLNKQVIGKAEEPKLDNDKPTEEASFDNDMTSTEKEGEPAVATEEPEVVEEPKAEEPEKDEGGAWDETDAEDDTADMKDTTGDVIDQDDVKADDTEEEFPWDDEEEKKPEDDILFDDDKKEKKESLNEEEQVNEGLGDAFDTVEDLLDDIIEPENIRKVNVYDSEGNEIYSGEYDPDSYTNTWVDELMAGWDVEEGRLILNITSDAGYNAGYTTLEDSLGSLDDATDKIDLFDVDTEEEIETGLTKEEVIENYGDWALASIEAPDVLNIYIDGGLEYEDIEEDDYKPKLTTDPYAAGQWYESLTKKICEANGLRYYRTEKEGTQEYYIQESIREKEDLGVIYEHFLRNIASAELINEFKEATGYRTTLDEMFEKETVVEGGSFKTDERESMKKAQKLSQDTDCNVVYGYTTSGSFYELPDMMSVATDRELQFATELVKAKYHPTGTVRVWYKKNNDTNLDESHEHHVCPNCGKEICECGKSLKEYFFPEYNIWANTKEELENFLLKYGLTQSVKQIGYDEEYKAYFLYTLGVPSEWCGDNGPGLDSPEAEEFRREADELTATVNFPDDGNVTRRPHDVNNRVNESNEKTYSVKVHFNEDQGTSVGWVCPEDIDNIPSDMNKWYDESFTFNGKEYSIINKGRRLAVKFTSLDEAEEVIKTLDKVNVNNSYYEYAEVVVNKIISTNESNEDEAEPIEAKKFENDEKTEIFTELPDYDVEVEQKGDKIEIELEPKNKVESFKTRKELADAIKECKNNNQPYKVTKSLTEGYRYDLIVESADEDREYIIGAQKFCKEIAKMDLETVEDTLSDYDFEHHAPEDAVEEMIYRALKERESELNDRVFDELPEFEELPEVTSWHKYIVNDLNTDINEEDVKTFDSIGEANRYFNSLKIKYAEDNTHTLYLWDSDKLNDDMEDQLANPKYLRKWNAQVGIKDEYKDPTLTEDYESGANAFIKAIAKMGLREVIDTLEDYDFEHVAPEDDVEQRIYDALKARKAELSKPAKVNESPDVPAVAADVEVVSEPEVIDAPTPDENAGTAIVPEGMDERDVELVNKLTRIANDTAEAIRANYGVDADPRLIVADMIQDLRLISGDIRPEQLAHTPMNDLTREMYAMYDGFNNFIDDMFLGYRRTTAQRLTQAIQALDGEEFSTPAIEQKIASDHFIEYVNRGAVPFLGTHIERLPAPEEENN